MPLSGGRIDGKNLGQYMRILRIRRGPDETDSIPDRQVVAGQMETKLLLSPGHKTLLTYRLEAAGPHVGARIER